MNLNVVQSLLTCVFMKTIVFFWCGGFKLLLLSLESRAVELSPLRGQNMLTVDALYRHIKGLSLILLVFNETH